MNDERTTEEKFEAELRAIAAEARHHPHPGEMVARLAQAFLDLTAEGEGDSIGHE